jgi:hypothetical protein
LTPRELQISLFILDILHLGIGNRKQRGAVILFGTVCDKTEMLGGYQSGEKRGLYCKI